MGGMGGPMMGGGQPQNVGNNNAVEFEKKLGNGAFGEVYQAKYQGQTVACKTTGNPTGFPKNEIALMREMQSEYVAVLIGEEHRTPKGDVILMKMYRGSLEDEIKRSGRGLSQERFLKYMEQVCRGLHFLHMKDVIFNDLKPDNVLMETDSDKLVLADFGDARRYDASVKRPQGNPHELGWGSPHYHCKPDVMSQMLTPKSDMWMLAQMACHMWTGMQPPTNPCRFSQNIPLHELLQKCLSDKPSDRPSAASMLGAIRRAIRDMPEGGSSSSARGFGNEQTNTKHRTNSGKHNSSNKHSASSKQSNQSTKNNTHRSHKPGSSTRTHKSGSSQRTAAA
jgi:serine/threonine protein kinase